MSIYALHGLLTPRICRQTLLWTTMRRRILSRPIAVVIRDAHSSLYQMVKKRTLEARTKLQANRFPNNQACAAQVDVTPGFVQSQPTTGKATTKTLHISRNTENMKPTAVTIPMTPINRNKPSYPSYPASTPIPSKKSSKQSTRSASIDESDKPTKECRNTEILRARDCNIRPAEDNDICDEGVKGRNPVVGWGAIADVSDAGTYSSVAIANDALSYGGDTPASVSSTRSSLVDDNEILARGSTASSGSGFFTRGNNASNTSTIGRGGAAIRNEIFPTSNVTGRSGGGAAAGSRASVATTGAKANVASAGVRANVASASGRSTSAAVGGRSPTGAGSSSRISSVASTSSRSSDSFVRDNIGVLAESGSRAGGVAPTRDAFVMSSKSDAVCRETVTSTFSRPNSRDNASGAAADDPCVKDSRGAYRGVTNKGTQNSAKDDDGCCDDGDNNGTDKKDRMMLYCFLAALGSGGLLWWLICGKKCKEPTIVVQDDKGSPKTIPASSADLPKRVPYLLIGGGTAAFSAFRAIKSNDPTAKVLMITDEMKKPYMRPPLSKELWYSASHGKGLPADMRFKQWTGAERSLFFEPDEFFVDPTALLSKPNGGIAVAQGFKVHKVNPEKRTVTLEDGYTIAYDECLIATGCSPKNLSLFADAPNSVRDKVMVYRTPDDFESLKKYADANKTIAVIGNGFTGSELACSLANYTKGTKARIYQIFPEGGNMSRVLPQYLSKWTTKKVESTGVLIINKATIKEATREDSKLKLTLSNGKTLLVDVAVVCIGCEPNTQLAGTSGLEVSNRLGGFVVNSELEARRNLYVAGDASCFYDPLLGRRRVEHHDHSVVSGRLAGENMTGKNNSYAHQSMFWSDLGPEIGYEGIGLVDASLPTVGVFALPSKTDSRTDNLTEERKETLKEIKTSSDKPPVTCDSDADEDSYGRGVIFYIKDNKIVGILLWNLFNRIGLARTIITQNKKYDDLNEVAKLFEIHA